MKRSVVGESSRRRGGNGVLCLTLLGLTLGAIGHVAVQAKKVEVAGMLAQERSTLEGLRSERRHLEIELGRLRDPALLTKLAKDNLGLTPEPGDIRRVGEPVVPVAPIKPMKPVSAGKAGTSPANTGPKPPSAKRLAEQEKAMTNQTTKEAR